LDAATSIQACASTLTGPSRVRHLVLGCAKYEWLGENAGAYPSKLAASSMRLNSVDTQREDLWRYFKLAKIMSEKLKEGSVDLRMFREIDIDGVYTEVEHIQARATVRAKRSS
jgi:hypothetical protein